MTTVLLILVIGLILRDLRHVRELRAVKSTLKWVSRELRETKDELRAINQRSKFKVVGG